MPATFPSAKTCFLLALVSMALSQLSSAAVLAQYTLNDTNELAATSVVTGVTAGNLVILDQVEDPDGGTLNNDTYQFTAAGLLINRKHPSNYWFPPANTVLAPFQFMLTAGAEDVQIHSVTMTASSPSTHVTAAAFGNNNTAEADYGAIVNFAAAGGTANVLLPSSFTILAGNSKTFYIDLNSSALDSTHLFGTIQVNGTVIPEPSSAILIASIGFLTLLRRRR